MVENLVEWGSEMKRTAPSYTWQTDRDEFDKVLKRRSREVLSEYADLVVWRVGVEDGLLEARAELEGTEVYLEFRPSLGGCYVMEACWEKRMRLGYEPVRRLPLSHLQELANFLYYAHS